MIFLRRLILLLFFAVHALLHAQSGTGERDSLLRTLKVLPDDTNKVNSLLRLNKIASAAQLYDSSIYYGKQALELSTRIGWEKGGAIANVEMGVSYWYIGNYTEALSCNYAALEIFQRNNDQKGIAQVNNNMGIVFASQKNYPKALECYLTTLAIKKTLGDNKTTASTYINIGTTYEYLQEYDKSFVYYREALVLKRQIGDKRGEGTCLHNIGLIHHKTGNIDSAYIYIEQGLELRRSINDKRGIVSSLAAIGLLHLNTGRYKEAERTMLEADTLSRDLGTIDLTRQIWDQLTTLYDTTGRYKDALNAFRIYTELTDSINLAESIRNSDKLEMNYEFETEKLAMQAEQDKQKALTEEADKQRMMWIIGSSIVVLIVTAFSISLFGRLRIIRRQKSIIEQQKLLVEEKSKEVIDSINYAKRIQYTLLAHDAFLASHLDDQFVFFQPKDIVSGDFYWASAQDDRFFLAVCDSTGHGVPGAFMSLLNISFLNEAIAERKMTDCGEILGFVRDKLIAAISQDGGQDGMDAVLLSIDKRNRKVQYAGANNSPVVVSNGQIIDCEGDKMPVGMGERLHPFTTHELQLKPGDVLYVGTDGFSDQFGGEKGKKYKRGNLLQFLVEISSRPAAEQKAALQQEFTSWKGSLEQVDDVLVMGVRF